MIKWLGTVASILGSFTVALGYLIPGYTLFMVGSISWLYIGFRTREMSLVTLNGVFFSANIVGLYRAFV